MEYLKNIYHKIQSLTETQIYIMALSFVLFIVIFMVLSILLTNYKDFKRADIKSRGKESLSNGKFTTALLVSLVASFFGIDSTGSLSVSDSSAGSDIATESYGVGEMLSYIKMHLPVILTVFGLAIILSLAMVVFVSNIIKVSTNRFFIENLNQKPEFKTLFWGFKNGRYLKICVSMFTYTVLLVLWSLLFIVPGVIKSYQYYMVPYLIAENPDISFKDAARISKNMMKGQKWKTFVLELSFMGWYIIGAFTMGIVNIFVNPYVNATFAALYERLRVNIPEEDKITFLSTDNNYNC